MTARVHRLALPAGVLLAAAALRLWDLDVRPGLEWDEPVYTHIAASVADGDGLLLKPSEGVTQAPYLYHPPFHFLLLGGWFRAAGDGIAQARVLGAVASVIVLVLLYVLMRRRWSAWALLPLAVLATDGWLVYTNRVGWIENAMLVLGVAGMLLYDTALRRGGMRWFVAAGALLGAASVYKHVGAYLMVAVAVTWLVVRARHREHAALLATAGLIVLVYATTMTLVFGDDFVDATTVQLERLTGARESRGSIGNAGQVIDAITGRYGVYAATLVLTGVAAILLARRAALLVRHRFAAGAAGDAVLFGWAVAAVASFAAMGLKMGHYFVLIQIPLFLFLASEVVPLLRRAGPLAATAAVAVLVAANLVAFERRIVSPTGDALAAVQRYTDASLPHDALVLTEEPVGTVIRQPYCKFHRVGACAARARYVIVYLSLTQAPPRDPRLVRLIAASRPVAGFRGWKERIVVLRTAGGGLPDERRRAAGSRRAHAASGCSRFISSSSVGRSAGAGARQASIAAASAAGARPRADGPGPRSCG